jgi:uncharacterized protein YjdB
MPFTFKLSQRLARIRVAAVVIPAAAAVLTACDVRRNPGTGVDNPVAQVIVSPDTLTLDPFESYQFRVFGRTQAGDSVPVSVRWTASAGVVTSGGMYTADTSAPNVTVTATLSSSSTNGTSNVRKRRLIQIVIDPKNTTVSAGGARQFTVYGRKNTGDSVSVSVTYAATGGTISGGGAYTAGQTAGVYRVIARQNGGSLADTSAVTVATVPVASVDVSPTTAALAVGQAAQLTATPKDASGNALTGRAVTWATSNTAVAAVSGSGLVTGVGAGSATITATSEGQSGMAAVTVSIVPVTSVTVSPATAAVAVGQTAQLTATPRDASGNALTGRVVTWATSNAAVATVSGSGLVTGVGAGSATITATSEGQSGMAAVTVSIVPVASVTVSPATASVAVGQTVQLAATPRDGSGNPLSGRAVTWATSNAAVATVNGSGLVTGVAAGGATITASSEGQSGGAAVTVTASVTNPGTVTNLTVASVTTNSVTLSFTEVTDGAGQPASYDIRWAAGTLSWASATSVAQGTCTVPVAGTAIGAARTCTVLGLAAGTSYQFQLVGFRGTLNVNAVFGALSNVASGTTTASTAPVASVTVSPASASLTVGATQQFTATLRDASGSILTGRTVTWASSAPLVASVTGLGLVSALVLGPATITATSEGIGGTATVTVTTGTGNPPLHEPAGFRAYNDQPWDLLLGNGWNYLRRSASKDADIVVDATAPRSPVDVLRIVFTTDMAANHEPGVNWLRLGGVREIYTAWWIKVSPNWQCSPAGCGKMTFVFTNGAGQVYTNLYNSASGQGAPYRVGVNTEWAPYGQRIWMPNATTTPINPGEWHRIEVYYRWETTPGSSGDGIVRWWVDGVLNGDYTTVSYPAASYSFGEFQFAPTLQNPPTSEMYMYVDHTYVSIP